jgi:MFS family permease
MYARFKLEPWYIAYAFLGIAVGGIFPIIIPLLALKRFEGVFAMGLVMGAFNLGWLLSPVWGSMADRHSSHREFLIAFLLIISVVLTALSYTTSLCAWLVLSVAGGIGVSGAVTLSNLFIIENHPRHEWGDRIGRLQMVNGFGQVVGMLLAALLSAVPLPAALLIAAGITISAVFPGRLAPKRRIEKMGLQGFVHKQNKNISCRHHLSDYKQQIPNTIGAKEVVARRNGTFGWLMAFWFLCVTGSTMACTLYPAIMKDELGIGQRPLSLGFALATGASVLLYALAGTCSRRLGLTAMIKGSLMIRWTAFLGLFLLLSLYRSLSIPLTFLSFFIVFLCWPFIGVGCTALTARLSTFGKGAGMGVFTAMFALAAVIGASVGGWLASWGGYALAIGIASLTDGFGLAILACNELS